MARFGISVAEAPLRLAGGIGALTRRIEAAENVRDLLPWEREPLGDLLEHFKGVHIAGFMHVPEGEKGDNYIVQAARLAEVPHVLCEPGKWAMSSLFARRGVTDIIAPSAPACAHWMESIAESTVPAARRGSVPVCHVINPGVDLGNGRAPLPQKRQRPPLRQTLAEGGEVVVAWIGRVAPVKGPGMFLRVAALLVAARPDVRFRFRVIGDGPLMGHLRALADALALSDAVVFDGWLPRREVLPALRRGVDLVLHTEFVETYCITNVQAMATARPLVSFGTAGVAEYLERTDVHGMVSPKPTPESMAKCVLSLLRHPGVAAAMGEAAARHVADLYIDISLESTGDKYVRLYTQLTLMNPQL